MPSVERLVILRVTQDYDEDAAVPEWWEGLGLPEPWRFSETFGAHVFAQEVLAERVAKDDG